jgi:hypothetical protein
MSPEEFIKKWRAVTVSEIAASQSHFNDLCALIDEPKPLDVDPTGERYAFEKHLFKLDGRPGRADVWKKGCFAWEYKRVGRYKSLAAAYGQLKEYSDALENPPLLIVCDGPNDISDDDALSRLFALNQERAAEGGDRWRLADRKSHKINWLAV